MKEFNVEHKIYSSNGFTFQGATVNNRPVWMIWHEFPNNIRGDGRIYDNTNPPVSSQVCPELSDYGTIFTPGNDYEFDTIPVVGNIGVGFDIIIESLSHVGVDSNNISNISPSIEQVLRITKEWLEVDVYLRDYTAGYFIHRIENTNIIFGNANFVVRNNCKSFHQFNTESATTLNIDSGYGDMMMAPSYSKVIWSKDDAQYMYEKLVNFFQELNSFFEERS